MRQSERHTFQDCLLKTKLSCCSLHSCPGCSAISDFLSNVASAAPSGIDLNENSQGVNSRLCSQHMGSCCYCGLSLFCYSKDSKHRILDLRLPMLPALAVCNLLIFIGVAYVDILVVDIEPR